MKTIIQILIAAVVINAAVRATESAWRYYSFKDAVEQEVLFGTQQTTTQLQQRVVDIAGDYDIELDPADVEVGREREETRVSFAYYEGIPLVPQLYTRRHLFEGDVKIRTLRGLK